MTVALACGHLSIPSFQQHKKARIEEGRQTILAVQAYRNPFCDRFFAAASFCAEEEFYLLTLPFIFWNQDWLFAHHLLYVVNIGLYIGNQMKDVFCLPRPRDVWRPTNLHQTDSSALLDFGFPSTHTMNSISNSGFAVLFYYCHSYSDAFTATDPTLPCAVAVLMAICYMSVLSLSRIYLGVHSPTDLRGGAVLGVMMMCTQFLIGKGLDRIVYARNPFFLFIQLFVVSFLFLLMCPQTRPPTPTFLQNAVNMGLIAGNMMGANLHHIIVHNEPTLNQGWFSATDHLGTSPMTLNIVRYVCGLVLVVASRAVAKTITGMLLAKAGFDIKPKKVPVEAPGAGFAPPNAENDQLKLRGFDLGGLAAQKFLVYFVLATSVVAVCPLLFQLCGLVPRGHLLTE